MGIAEDADELAFRASQHRMNTYKKPEKPERVRPLREDGLRDFGADGRRW